MPLMQNKHWQALVQHQRGFASSLLELFKQDGNRFQNFSLEACDILFDYSKQRVQSKTMDLLYALVEASDLRKVRNALFAGENVNLSEEQPALHTALRDPAPDPILLDGSNIKIDIQTVLQRLESFAEDIRQQRRLGASGKPFQDVVCLGIGGSELGPVVVSEALKSYLTTALKIHFVSNVDAKTLSAVLNSIDPHSTLCIISSKTFTTPETLQNAKVVKSWLEIGLKNTEDTAKHLVAVTANAPLAVDFGILPEQIFEFWRWVGGRYSVWSAVGLPIILAIGMKNFKEFLAGAYAMDRHFQTAAWNENMPVIMALLSIWNRNFWNFPHQAIMPYDDALEKLPAYIQQLEMESNGKSVNQQGEALSYATAPLIWGGVGCNGQHAFMQLLHQGTDTIPVDFLIAVQGDAALPQHQKLLLANCLAQSKALMEGFQPQDKTLDKFKAAKHCPGNRPSSTLIYSKLTPRILGSLLALFEHKVFVQGVIWGINSFDQWGVELGKTLARNILKYLENNPTESQTDSSTKGLLDFINFHQENPEIDRIQKQALVQFDID